MKITCHSCGAKYAIADEKVRGRRVKVRCKSCKTAIVVDGYSAEAEGGEYGGGGDEEDSTRVHAPAFAAPTGGSWSVNLTDTDQRTMTSEEIVAAWHAGELPQDSFVWREGMDDWLGVFDVPELASALSAAPAQSPYAASAQDPYAAPSPQFAAPPSAPPPAAAPFGGGFGLSADPQPARVTGGRAQVERDLFGAAAAAGGEADPGMAVQPGATGYDQRMTGARNENSVLFSLDALKAGIGPAATKSAPVASRPKDDKANLDDLMGMGGGGTNALFGLAQNQSLLSAPPPPPEPPPRPAFPSDPALGAAASIAPGMMPPARNNKLVFALGGAVALLLVVVAVLALAFMGGKDDEKVAKADSGEKSGKKDDTKSGAAEADKPNKEEPANKEAPANKEETTNKDEPAAPDSTVKKEVSEEDKKRFAEAQKKKEEEKTAAAAAGTTTAKTEAVAKKEEPSTGVASFNKQAAIAALSSAASAATRCKRPDGPTGSGKAIVTFAPSGRVTSANITGGSFGGSPVGGCISGVFRSARVPAFSGDSVTVSKGFNIP